MKITTHCGPRYQHYMRDLTDSIHALGLPFHACVGFDHEDEREVTEERIEEIENNLRVEGCIIHLHADCILNRRPDLLMQPGFFSQYDVAVTRRNGDIFDTVCLALNPCPAVNAMMDKWWDVLHDFDPIVDHGDVTLTRAVRWAESERGLRVYYLPPEYHHIPGMTDIKDPVITHFAHRNGPVRSETCTGS